MNPTVVFQQLSQLFQLAKYIEFVSLAKQHLNLVNAEPNIMQMYCVCLRRLGEKKLCQAAFIKAVKKFPEHVQLLNSYGNFLVEINQLEQAKQQFSKALSKNVNHFDSNLNLGRVYSLQDDFSNALHYFKIALSMNPQSQNALVGTADSYRGLGDIPKAEKLYVDGIQNGLTNSKLFNNLATIRRSQDRIDEAIILLQKALMVQPEEPTTLRNLAACWALNNDNEKAMSLYRKAINANPFDVDSQGECARLLWSLGDKHPFKQIQQNLGDPGVNERFWIWFINLLLEAEEHELASQYTEQLLAAVPNSFQGLSLLGRIQRLNKQPSCIDSNRQALKKSKQPNNKSLLNELGYSLLAFDKNVEASSIYSKLTKIDKLDQGWWTLLSTCFKRLNKVDKYQWLCDYDNFVFAADLNGHVTNKGSELDIVSLQQELKKMHKTTRHPIGQSLRGGTQTFEDLFDNQSQNIQTLKDCVLEKAMYFISAKDVDSKHPFLSRVNAKELEFVGSWSVSLESEGFHKSHFHPQGWLSGVCYIDLPTEIDSEGQGWLCFGKPEIENDESVGDYIVKPKIGQVVFFPSYMWHGTRPFKSSTRRLTVAFDITPIQK